CLAYELDAYIDARKSLPRVNAPLQALDGDYHLVSSDVLRGMMSFSTVKEAAVGNVTLNVDKVREILDMNRKGKKPDTIAGIAPVHPVEEEPAFVNMAGEESITRFDRSPEGRCRRRRGGQNRNRNADGGGNADGGSGYAERQGKSQAGDNRDNRDNRENRGGQNRNGENRGGGRNRRLKPLKAE
ncbi:MAG: hypothetical protein LBU98_01860, partial [Alistipes sp.]|nr:hypothetical protein [Alistipes sp.]